MLWNAPEYFIALQVSPGFMCSASEARALRARASVTGYMMPGRDCMDTTMTN